MSNILGPDDQMASLFIRTVQGDYSPTSCVINNRQLTISNNPVRWHAEPDLQLLSQYLGSDHALLDPIQDWIVNLFEQDDRLFYGYGQPFCKVKEILRRKAGRPRSPRFPTWIDSLPSDAFAAVMSLKSSAAEPEGSSDLTILSRVLDQSRPWSTPLVDWLANIFDPHSNFDFKVKEIVRRQVGQKSIGHNPDWRGWQVEKDYREYRNNGKTSKEAIYLIQKEHCISQSAVNNLIDIAGVGRNARKPKM